MLRKNVFGNREYAVTKNNCTYIVNMKPNWKGKFEIVKYNPQACSIVRTAMMPSELLETVYPGMFWVDVPEFDSFVQAVKFLKAHLQELF